MIKRRFSANTLETIRSVQDIIGKAKLKKKKLTTKQIFCELSSKQEIEDKPKEYKRLVSVIGKARKAGLIGWDDIYGTKQPRE